MLSKPEKLLPAKQWREGTADSQAVKEFIHTEPQQELQSWLDDDDDR